MFIAILLTCGTAIFFGILLLFFYLHRKRCQRFFKQLGIDGPQPNWLFGNLHCLKEKLLTQALTEWTEDYGRVFGYYEGSTPVLVLGDADAVHDVLVKKFHCFHSRKDFPLLPDPDNFDEVNVFLARGQKWKQLRSICNPNFSAAKMKQMKPFMDKCIATLMGVLKRKADANEEFDIYPFMQGLTLDVIAETGFGVETNAQIDQNDPFLLRCRKFFNSIDLVKGPALLVASLFPELKSFWVKLNSGLHMVKEMDDKCLNEYAENIIETRKMGHMSKRLDLLQLMLDSCATNGSAETNHHIQSDNNGDQNKTVIMTKKELVSQSVLLLVAGYETTSTTMAFTLHLLATHAEVRQKLQEEIDDFMASKGQDEIAYDDLQQLSYMDMVVNEALRMYPVGSLVVFRKCMETCEVGSGFLIPEGTSILVNVWGLHHDEELWGPVDTKKFYPERFLPEAKKNRHPMAWVPFGGGPRFCLGMRFALLEIKLALCQLLHRFDIQQCSKTEIPIKLKEGATVTPLNGCTVRLVNRINK